MKRVPLRTGPDTSSVSLEESECVTSNGTTTTTFRARVQNQWIAVGALPTASARNLPTAPGVVWRRIVDVQLAVGTAIEKTVTSTERDRGATTAGVLFGRQRGTRQRCRRTLWLVTASGQLKAARDD